MARRKNDDRREEMMEAVEMESREEAVMEEGEGVTAASEAGNGEDGEAMEAELADEGEEPTEEDFEQEGGPISTLLAAIEEDGEESGSLRHMRAVRELFDENGYSYTMKKDTLLKGGFKLESKLGRVNIFVSSLYNRLVKVVGVCPLNADENTRAAVCEYVARANYGLIEGNFEIDMRDGEVRYKMTVSEHDGEISPKEVDHAIDTIVNMFERYGDGLGVLMMGFSDPETEIEKAEGD